MTIAVFKVNLTILKGSTFSRLVTWKTGSPALPVDLTGCKARMQVRAEIDSPDVLAEFTTEDGGIILGNTAGTIEYAILTATESAAIDWESGVYDLEIVFADTVTVQRKIKGSVSISQEVTRDP